MSALTYDQFRDAFGRHIELPIPVRQMLGELLTKKGSGENRARFMEGAYASTKETAHSSFHGIQRNLSVGGGGEQHFWVLYYHLHLTENSRPELADIDRMLLEGATFPEFFGRPVSYLPQPHLSFPESARGIVDTHHHTNGLAWLSPLSQAIPFAGREREIALLGEFASDSRPFLFWGVTGPSGAGKTRLIAEWMRALRASPAVEWNTGFLTVDGLRRWKSEFVDGWRSWVPDRPTLIGIDYLHVFARDFLELFARCQALAGAGSATPIVRVILVDHTLPKDLEGIFRDPRFSAQIGAVESGSSDRHFFRAQPMELGLAQQSPQLLFDVMTSAIEHHGGAVEQSDVIEALENLRQISGAWSPLFAALRGKALAIRPTTQFADRDQLIRFFLLSENRLLWTPHQDRSERSGLFAAAAVAAATAVHGVNFEDVARTITKAAPSESGSIPYIHALAGWQVSSTSRIHLPAMQPDALGGAFFLLAWEEFASRDPVYRNAVRDLVTDASTFADAFEKAERLLSFAEGVCNTLREESVSRVNHHWETLIDFLRPHSFLEGSLARQASVIARARIRTALGRALDSTERAAMKPLLAECISNREIAQLTEATAGPLYNLAFFALKELLEEEEPPVMPADAAEALFTAIHNAANAMFAFGRDGVSPLFLAAENGFGFAIGPLLRHRPDYLGMRRSDGALPIHAAAARGHDAIVRQLLDHDPSQINAKTLSGATPLSLAARSGFDAVVETLLARSDIDPNRGSRDGINALILAVQNGHKGVVRQLLGHPAINVNHQRQGGIVALSVAASKGHADIVTALLAKDALNPNLSSRSHSSAIHVAVGYGFSAIVKLLIEDQRVNVNKIMAGRDTPLSLAARLGHLDCVRELLSSPRIKPNRMSKKGMAPLHWGCLRNDPELAKMCIDHPKVNPNLHDHRFGGTPLIMASAVNGLTTMQGLLARSEVSVNAVDRKGLTAWDYAEMSHYTEATTLLSAHGGRSGAA